MLGTSYRTLSEDELMEAINHGIRIPAYEKLDQLNTEFETLRVNLQDLESRYNAPGGTAASRLANTIALMQILENIQKNRTEFTALGKSDPQALSYSEKLNALGPEITRLTEEARKERVSQVRDQLQAQIQELSAIQTQVRQKPPSSMGEWQQRSDDLDKYSTLLDERQKLLDKLQNEKEAPSPDDVKNMSESRAEIQTTRASLQNEHQQIELALQNEHQQAELADLTTQYRDLTEKRKQMLNAYLLAFGTAKEKVAKQNLIAVLDQMVANRDRAAALGDKTAATQLTQFRAEAEKYKNK
jgi:chromosome segregation ATPase